MLASIMAALKGIAAIPKILTEIKEAYIGVQNKITATHIAEIKSEMNIILARLENEEDRNKILDLVDSLNVTISK